MLTTIHCITYPTHDNSAGRHPKQRPDSIELPRSVGRVHHSVIVGLIGLYMANRPRSQRRHMQEFTKLENTSARTSLS